MTSIEQIIERRRHARSLGCVTLCAIAFIVADGIGHIVGILHGSMMVTACCIAAIWLLICFELTWARRRRNTL